MKNRISFCVNVYKNRKTFYRWTTKRFVVLKSLPLYFFSFSIYNKVYLLSTNNIS